MRRTEKKTEREDSDKSCQLTAGMICRCVNKAYEEKVRDADVYGEVMQRKR